MTKLKYLFEIPTYEAYELEYAVTGLLRSGALRKKPSHVLNKKQLHTAYQTHLRKLERIAKKKECNSDKNESLDKIIRDKCFERDHGYCQAMALFNGTEYAKFTELSNGLEAKLDAAHVFGKGAFPHMRYVPENVVMVNRVSHNWLDTCRSPVDGKQISVEEKNKWWKRIVGADRYEFLETISREGLKL